MKLTAFSAPHRRKDNFDWFDMSRNSESSRDSLCSRIKLMIILRYGGEKILKKLRKDLA
jgi:hypothetical protein